MIGKPPHHDHDLVRSRLHQRIRRLDYLLSRPEQEEESGLSPAVKVILVLAVITFVFVCIMPIVIFLRLLFR